MELYRISLQFRCGGPHFVNRQLCPIRYTSISLDYDATVILTSYLSLHRAFDLGESDADDGTTKLMEIGSMFCVYFV